MCRGWAPALSISKGAPARNRETGDEGRGEMRDEESGSRLLAVGKKICRGGSVTLPKQNKNE